MNSYANAGPLERVLVLGFAVLVVGSIGFMGWWFNRDDGARADEGAAIAVSPSPSVAAAPATGAATPGLATAAPATPAPGATRTLPPPVSMEELFPGSTASGTPTPRSEEDLAEVRALAEPGGPAEVFGPAEQVADLESPLHQRWWRDFKPAPVTDPEWEWANKEELWNAVVAAVWDDAVSRYENRIHPLPGTVFPGNDRSGNAVWAWASHTERPRFGYLGLASVALTSETPGQRRPDLAVYWYQVKVTPTDDPHRFVGELHRVYDPFEMPGTIPWTGYEGGEVSEFIRDSPQPPMGEFDVIQSKASS
ncbi:MAG: hypothetical protein H0V93_16720 [Euzebyales bacterium]|nr:hypothetical protein [Euzebyales bacterium]